MFQRLGRFCALGLAVFFLLMAAALVVEARAASASNAEYEQAGACPRGTTANCRQELSALVTGRHTTTSKGNTTYYVDVTLPDGRQASYTGRDLYPYVRNGQQISAEHWQGKLIRLHDGQGHQLRTDAHPAVIAERDPWGAVAAIVAVFFFLGVFGYLSWLV